MQLGERLVDAEAASEVQDDLTEHEQLCKTLARAVDKAEGECEATWLSNWRTSAATGRGNAWTAWTTLLERRFPARWSKRPQEAATANDESLEDSLRRIREHN